VNNGAGGYFIDKEKDLVFNAQYHSILTDCTDPVHCLSLTLAADYAWVTPGDITKNTDWTRNGLGNAKKTALSAELSWGVSRNGTTRPVFWRADFEVQYLKVWQDLPGNCNGNVSGVCLAPTALPVGIAKDPDSWVFRTTITYDW
jgi:hypothetical protein